MRFLFSFSLFLLVTNAIHAQDKPAQKPGDAMIEKYLAAETAKLSAKVLDGAKTLDEWKAKRPRLYQEYMDMLGLWPIPEKTPLKATVTGQLKAHSVVVENLHFQSKPGLYVTANLYRPKDAAGAKRKQYPAIVYVCGHSNRGRDGNKTAFQDHGFWFANNGYVCLVLDTLQLGEIPGVHHGTYGRPWLHLNSYEASRERKRPENAPKNVLENRFWWHSIGYSPAAVECWNGVRAIDYLVSRPDVDPDKIGVTGISGGGAATFWIAAADERVKVAVPVSGMADLESYVKNKVINGHCDCMFLYNTYQWDWTTIAALVAPRPMLFANSNKDPIFPMDANRRVINNLYKVYDFYGMENNIDECISVVGHDYRPDLRVPIFQFFNRHLKRDTKSKVEDSAKYTPIDGKKLRVFPTDADVPKDAINARIDETFIPAAKVALPGEGRFAEWKKEMIAKLREQSFRHFPERIPGAVGHRASANGVEIEWSFTQSKIEIMVVKYGLRSGEKVRNILVLNDEENAADLLALSKGIIGEWDRDVLAARGIDAKWDRDVLALAATNLKWARKSPPNYVERSHLLLGSTVDQGRVWDIAAIFRQYEEHRRGPANRRAVGRGQAGILAAYAALFEPSIKEVIVIDPPKSHKEGPHFLNVLRVLDIPEALGLLAPTPLTIIGGMDPAFNRTAEIYRLAGAADKLKRK